MSGTPTVELFDLREGVLVVFDPEAGYDEVVTAFAQALWQWSDRFQGQTVVIDVGDRILTTQQFLDLEALINGTLGVRVLQIVNNEALDVLAEEGLDPVDIGRLRALMGDDPTTAAGDPAVPGGPSAESTRQPAAPARGGPGEDAPAGAPDVPGEGAGTPAEAGDVLPLRVRAASSPRAAGSAVLLRRTVRSGQRIAYDGDVVILGDVNPGAEVVASGDIVIVGSLRGLAHAGARGDDNALVAALDLRPVQLRIGPYLGRSPEEPNFPTNGRSDRLEVALVREGRIVIEDGLRRDMVWAKSSW